MEVRTKLTALSLSLLFIIPLSVSAQTGELEENENIRNTIENIFEHIDKGRISTGLLLDYATDLVEIPNYDGTHIADSNAVDADLLNYILRSVRSAGVSATKPFKGVNSIFDEFSSTADDINDIRSTNVGVVAFRYNYLPEDALSSGKIQYSNGQVYDKFSESGEWINPYDSALVFAFSPFENYFTNGSITFRFPAGCIFSNLGIRSMEFDAGNGNGFTAVFPDGAVTEGYSAGEYELKMRLTLEDGTQLMGHSRISVESTMSLMSEDPGYHIVKFASRIAPSASAIITIDQKHDQIQNPMIIVEGFEPSILYAFNEDEEDKDGNAIPYSYERKLGTSNYNSFISVAKSSEYFPDFKYFIDNYDIIYVDWLNSEAPIESNADILIQIIDWVNEQKSGSKRNIVLGESMGGLVARYALRKMEMAGKAHQTSIFVSYDSPHLGVNVPIGGQYLLMQMLDFVREHKALNNVVLPCIHLGYRKSVSASELADFIEKLFNTKSSATQMMYYTVTSSRQVTTEWHDAWQNKLSSMGLPRGDAGFPIKNVAFSNGSDPLIYGNNDLLKFDFSFKTTSSLQAFTRSTVGLLLNLLLPGISNCTPLVIPGSTHIEASAYALPYCNAMTGSVAGLRIDFTKKLLWMIPIKVNVCDYSNIVPSSVLPFDGVYGSLFQVPSFPNIPFSRFHISEYILFVPTASAFCIGGGGELPLSQYQKDSSAYQGVVHDSPFDHCLLTSDYFGHTFTDNKLYSLLRKVESNVGYKISGDLCPPNGAQYNVVGVQPGAISWSVNQEWATISSDGKLRMSGIYGGVTTVIATWDVQGVPYSDSLKVQLGLPQYTLEKDTGRFLEPLAVPSYREEIVRAKCSESSAMSEFKDVSNLRYEWGYRFSLSDNIIWQESERNRITIEFPSEKPSGYVYVYLRVKNRHFTSETYSIKIYHSGRNPFPDEPIIRLGSSEVQTDSYSRDLNEKVQSVFIFINSDNEIVVVDEEGQLIDSDSAYLKSLLDSDTVSAVLERVRSKGESNFSTCKVKIDGVNCLVNVVFKEWRSL